MLMSSTAFSAGGVAVGQFAPFADTVYGAAGKITLTGAVALENAKSKKFTDCLVFDAVTFDSCDSMTDGMGGGTCMNPGGFDGMMATTALYSSSGGGPNEEDVVETVKVGEIDFEILNCNEATATVRLDDSEAMTYNARQLTRLFPCVDAEEMPMR